MASESCKQSRYNEIEKNGICKMCIFGIEDLELRQQFLHVIRHGYRFPRRSYWNHNFTVNVWPQTSQINNVNDAITHYKSGQLMFYGSAPRLNSVRCHIINSFLTEEVYNDESIKYSNIIKSHEYPTIGYWVYFAYAMNGNPRYYINQNDNTANTQTNIDEKDEEEEQKYANDDDKNEKITLRTKHIMAADGFMIVYDVRYQSELDKVKKYLDEIFEMKGYNKMIDKLRKDEMCLFPVSLVGINMDLVEEEREQISNIEISTLASEYCVDTERIYIFSRDDKGKEVPGDSLLSGYTESLVQSMVDYQYYISLSHQQINKLKEERSDCIVL